MIFCGSGSVLLYKLLLKVKKQFHILLVLFYIFVLIDAIIFLMDKVRLTPAVETLEKEMGGRAQTRS